MRKVVDGSSIERGRKNRRNISRQVVRKPAMLAHTMRRRILLTAGSGSLSTTAPEALGVGGAAAAFATGADGGPAEGTSLVGVTVPD